jgi:hypothetical protein
MKEIEIPLSTTFTIKVDTYPMKFMNGLSHLGTINVMDAQPDLRIARENGAKIIYGVLTLEQRIESVISYYLFGPVLGHPKREKAFFDNEILQTDKLTFAFKKKLLDRIIERHDFLPKIQREELESTLNAVMRWRNAFAHGRFVKDNVQGVVVQYYSGDKRSLTLDDKFWDDAEKAFAKAHELFQQLDSRLNEYLMQKHA